VAAAGRQGDGAALVGPSTSLPVGGRRQVRNRDLAIGAIGGVTGGLLGIGGGVVIVPLLALWTRMTQRRAGGTSLAAILPIATVGAFAYYFGSRAPQIDLKVAAFVMLGTAAGAALGAGLAPRISEYALKVLVAVLLVLAAVEELREALLGGAVEAGAATHLGLAGYALIVLLGVVIGAISGLTGVGGGVLLVPTLVLGFGIGQRVAQGTSLLAILPNAVIGAIIHRREGNLDLPAAGWISLSGVPGVLAGAVLALLLPQRLLAVLFGLLLVAMAVRTWPRRGPARGA
jgi:uncharacterized protein